MRYKISHTDSFDKKVLKFFKKHQDIFDRFQKTVILLSENPFHPSLRLHKLQGNKSNYYSVSITMSYRIILDFIIIDEEIILIDIGSHDDVY